jgi:hypothetical protein
MMVLALIARLLNLALFASINNIIISSISVA